MTELRKNARKTPGRPFQLGNPGRPKGARHKVTLAAEALLDGQAEGLTQKAVDLALAGDTTALRLCLERIYPVPKGRRVNLALPAVDTAADVSDAQRRTLQALAEGELTPDEAATISGILEAKRRAIETVELDQRIAAIERGMQDSGKP